MKRTKLKQIGVWMDHEEAQLLEPVTDAELRVIQSGYSSRERIPGESPDGTRLGNYRSTNNENHKHKKKQNQLNDYYKKLSRELAPYDEIFLLGQATAYKEFRNYLAQEKSFASKRIISEASEQLPKGQLEKKVSEFFAHTKST